MITSRLNKNLYRVKNHALYRFTEQVIRREIGLRPLLPDRPKYRVPIYLRNRTIEKIQTLNNSHKKGVIYK